MRQIMLTILLLLPAMPVWAATHEQQTVLTYSNTDFNQAQPGWSDTLTLYNNSAQPMVITQLQFETNYNTLDTSQLYGSIYHSATPAAPQKIKDFDYRYTLTTESPWNKGTYTTIPANGSVTLTQIPLAHEQTSTNGIPLYYRLPFNIQVMLQDGSQLSASLQNKCQENTCQDPAAGKMIGAYYTDWANYHYSQNPANLLMPGQIPIANMNTIFYAIGKIDSQTAAINFVDINHDQYYFPAFDTLKQQYPYLNLMYSFGGWGDAGSNSYPSYTLAAIFDQQDPKLTQTLADNMVNTMLELGFNGIDIDYEWNAIQPGTTELMQLTPARAHGFQELLQDIRNDLIKLQPQNNPHFYKLTTAVFAGPDQVTAFTSNGGDWTKVAAAVDYIDVMTYDMHGQFDTNQAPPDNITDFHSQMKTEHHYQADILNHYNVVDAIDAYKNIGVPASKLVAGIPAYTRIEKTALPVTDDNKGLYLTLATDQPAGEMGSGGVTDYKCIINDSYCWGGFHFNRANMVSVPANLSEEGLGHSAKTPWAYDKSQNWFLSFDNGISVNYKANWVKQNNLGGVMVWEIDGDVPATDANYQRDSIIYNAWAVLH